MFLVFMSIELNFLMLITILYAVDVNNKVIQSRLDVNYNTWCK